MFATLFVVVPLSIFFFGFLTRWHLMLLHFDKCTDTRSLSLSPWQMIHLFIGKLSDCRKRCCYMVVVVVAVRLSFRVPTAATYVLDSFCAVFCSQLNNDLALFFGPSSHVLQSHHHSLHKVFKSLPFFLNFVICKMFVFFFLFYFRSYFVAL